jgi:hypothetical protein
MTTYSGRIIREQGGSVLNVASGGSLNITAGALLTIASGGGITFPAGGNLATSGVAQLSGGVIFGQASQTQVAGGAILMSVGASMNVNVTTADQGTFRVTDGTRSAFFGIGREAPTHTASPGSLFIRSDGSMTGFYWNKSSGTTGSVWQAAASA